MASKPQSKGSNVKPETNSSIVDFQTKPSLSNSLCDKTFKNVLRGDEKTVHKETALTNSESKTHKRREQVSHIFSGEDDSSAKKSSQKKYVPSSVLFNDAYVEKNPKINKGKQVRYEIENKLHDQNKNLYSDELIILPGRQQNMNRKVQDTYGRNPLKVVDQAQTKEINDSEKQKYARRTEAVTNYMTSEKLRGTFDAWNKQNKQSSGLDKITNCDFEAMKAASLQNKEGTNYGKKHFRIASCGNGGAFTYL